MRFLLAKFTVLMLFFSTASGQLFAQKVQVESFSIEQGLADRIVNDIVKDHQGFLWVATDNGLDRFDGYSFLHYDSRPRNRHKIKYNKVRMVTPDREGRLLIHYEAPLFGEPDLLDPLTGDVTQLDMDTSQGTPLAVFQSPEGDVYFLSVRKERVAVFVFDENEAVIRPVFEAAHPGVNNNCFVSFIKASDGTFWFAYNWEYGFELLLVHSDASGNTIRAYRNANLSLPPGHLKGMVSLTETAGGEILFMLDNHGVFIKDPDLDAVFKPHPHLPKAGYYFSKDKKGNLLAYQVRPTDPAEGCYLILAEGPVSDYSWVFERQSMMEGVYSDDFTTGFLAGTGNGFHIYQLRPNRFSSILDKDLGNEPYGTSIRGIAKAGRSKLFIATEREGLYELDLVSNTLARTGDRLPGLAPVNQMQYPRNLLVQGDSVLWMPFGRGLLKYFPTRGYHELLLPTFKELMGITFGKDGWLWVILRDGRLLRVDPSGGGHSVYQNNDGSQPLENTQPAFIMTGRDGTLWVGTTLGGLVRIDPEKRESRRFTADQADPSGFNSNNISCIYEDKDGLLWIGTMESGMHVFDPLKGLVTATYSRENGLLNSSVAGILPDDRGNFWVSTYYGLSFFDTELKTFRNYTAEDGLPHNEFNRFAFFFDRENNRFYFGGMNGLSSFASGDPQPSNGDAPLLISEMSITGRRDEIIQIQEGIVDGSTIILEPGSRFLQLKLALGAYNAPRGNQFSYQIEGRDRDWNSLGTNRELRIDHLPPGVNSLRIRGADNRGNWSSKEITLRLVVRQFWYKRWWAYLLYAFAFASAGIFFYRFQLGRKMAEEEAQRLQQLDAFKTRFFTNISHEFRTPLTVILGMVEPLKTRFAEGAKPEHDHAAEMIRRNSQQLLNLVNQLLDLSRLESGKLKLSPANGDLVAFLQYQAESFESFAQTRQVGLFFQSDLPGLEMAFDHEKMQAVIVNLISNAIKFTPEGGRVEMELQQPGAMKVEIVVRDTGLGIPADQLPRIFDRFYQVDDSLTRKGEGTGIGLALVQELIKLMNGEIKVESAQGKGTLFRILLPFTPPDPALQSHGESPSRAELLLQGEAHPWEESAEDDERPLLLIVEDNPDVRFYIAECVRHVYRLSMAGNGEEGIQKARELIPDIIVSDVMMPEKDGFELCETLKNDSLTSHIPIVLLTARADFESRIAGLKRGADDYLAKPFEPGELLVRLENLVRLRRLLQARYAAMPAPEEVSPDPGLALEDAFLIRIREVVVEHLSDTEFGIPHLEQALNMSRSQVFRKVKALTGASPSVLVRTIRLHQARELLLSTSLSISEIAYEVGFSTPAYFSTTFQEEFGKTPSEFRSS